MILSLVLSTIAFFVAAFYLRRYLDTQGVNKGFTRSVLVFLLATIVSIGTSSVIDFISTALEGEQSQVASTDPLQISNINQLMHSLSAVQGRQAQ
ncbi:hypothetical protein [Sulfurirhabdus autotrophica]|uniref:Uncharacterized protein n=1 Tax=Sulfurirhabdus autotrophica TaxID=1706046 RepID=A0A4R3XW13_9PROT|nr:hypothetical protein [Sulfurirhabdus autotrophica]TCV83380.1 hypothetical protein EDC63_1155 [Sulfurirhabdus autotrophica]